MKPWYVITGAPSSGKSTLIAALNERGHTTVEEAARILIDDEMAKGLSIDQIRSNEHDFQLRILRLKLEIEAGLPQDEVVFLDRGIPDTTAYLRAFGFPEGPELSAALATASYRKVFILDPLEFERDYSRTEDLEVVERLDQLLEDSYVEVGHPIHRIPRMSVDQRVEHILSLVQ